MYRRAYYYVVKNKVTGEVSEMLSTDYQDKWQDFDFIEATDKIIVLQEGYEPPIKDFSIFKDGIDYTYSILNEDNVFLLICYNIDKTSSFKQEAINTFYKDCQTAGFLSMLYVLRAMKIFLTFARIKQYRIFILFYR